MVVFKVFYVFVMLLLLLLFLLFFLVLFLIVFYLFVINIIFWGLKYGILLFICRRIIDLSIFGSCNINISNNKLIRVRIVKVKCFDVCVKWY